MKRSAAVKSLPLMLVLALAAPGPASGERSLPDFSLNSMKIRGIPELPRGAIPPVPPPVDTGYYARATPGGIRLDSSIMVVVDGEEGRAEIKFPGAEFGEARSGCRSSLFIRFTSQNSAPALSWASVLCSGRKYLGYKGSSLQLAGKSGDFAIKDDNLALGPMKNLLSRTHPWIIAPAQKDGYALPQCLLKGPCPPAGQDLDQVCSADFPGKMKAYPVQALPPEADGETGGFSFKYDKTGNSLTVTWPIK